MTRPCGGLSVPSPALRLIVEVFGNSYVLPGASRRGLPGNADGGQTRRRPQSGLSVAADGREPRMCLLLLYFLMLLFFFVLSGSLLATGSLAPPRAPARHERSVFTSRTYTTAARHTNTRHKYTHTQTQIHTRAHFAHRQSNSFLGQQTRTQTWALFFSRGQSVGCRLPFGWLLHPPPSHTVAYAHRKSRMGAKMFTIFEQQSKL